MCEEVSERVISYGVGRATTISISVRDTSLNWFSRQCKFKRPTVLSQDFFDYAVDLFEKNYQWNSSVRSIGVAVSGFTGSCDQVSLADAQDVEYQKKYELEKRVRKLKEKYGNNTLRKGITLCDKQFCPTEERHENGITKIHEKSKKDS